jgi:hypothetical protein
VPTVAIDTSVTVDKTTAQTLTNKTLTSPALTTPTISTATTNGDLLYGTGSGALTRLGIGSAAQVLTVASGVPTWAAPASSGGMTLLSTTALSGASTTISIVGGYKNLQIYVKDFYASSDADITMRLNGDATAANYQQMVIRARTAFQSFVTNATDGFDIAGYQTGTAQADNFSQITIYDYDQATTNKTILATGVIKYSTTKSNFITQGSYYGTVAAVTGITIVANAGTFSAGSVEIYGVK